MVFEKGGVYLHTSARKHQDPDSLIAGVIRVVEKVGWDGGGICGNFGLRAEGQWATLLRPPMSLRTVTSSCTGLQWKRLETQPRFSSPRR